MIRLILMVCVSFSGFFPLLIKTSAYAQETQKQDSILLDRIIVGAGIEKVAVETPQAVTVIGQEEINREQATTVGELLDNVPGAQAIGSNRIAGQSFNIRGIGGLAAADESRILVNVDGVTKFHEQYRVGSLFADPELYKNIEVLRGPASSTLYGAGALGGIINLTTKDASDFLSPEDTTTFQLKNEYHSNQDGFLISPLIATRLGNDTEVLITGTYRQGDNYENGDGNEISGSEFESFSGLVKATHNFGFDLDQQIRVSYERFQSDLEDTDYSQTGTLSFGTIDRNVRSETAIISYQNEFMMNELLDLDFQLSYSNVAVIQNDSSFSRSPSPLFLPAKYGYRTFNAKLDNTSELITDDFENYLTLGSLVSRQERTAKTDAGRLDFHPEGTDIKLGFYGQNEFIWKDRLTLIPGLRADVSFLETDLDNAENISEIAWSPKIAGHFKLTDNIAFFASYAHTQRTPTLDEFYSESGPGRGFFSTRTFSPDLNKERSNNFEGGVALSGSNILFNNDAGALKFVAFHNSVDDLIAVTSNRGDPSCLRTVPTPARCLTPYFVNVEEATIKGIEVEAEYDAEIAFIRLTYSAIDGKNDTTGATLDTIPANTLSTTVGARIPNYGLEFGVNSNFVASINTGATTGPFDSYDTHNIYASWQPQGGFLDGLELRLGVDNVFDTQYRNNLAGDDGPGRNFKVSLSKSISF